MRSEQETVKAIERYADTVRRLCVIHLKNDADTEDIFQTVFLKYVLSSVSFENDEHEKAWFIRVTINACKDLLRSFFRGHTVSLDEVPEQPAELPPDYRDVWDAVFSLPQNYRDVVYLHYFEDYTAPQISRILGKNVNTVYTLLTRSKRMLREKLGGEYDYE
nr:sigma-70 family RNA polymerase sigma factor [uncultured Oscillibacter sp.]